MLLRRSLALAALLAALPLLAQAPEAAPKGQRIFVCGHSFHVPIATPLEDVARLAGVADHELLGTQFLGGSRG